MNKHQIFQLLACIAIIGITGSVANDDIDFSNINVNCNCVGSDWVDLLGIERPPSDSGAIQNWAELFEIEIREQKPNKNFDKNRE